MGIPPETCNTLQNMQTVKNNDGTVSTTITKQLHQKRDFNICLYKGTCTQSKTNAKHVIKQVLLTTSSYLGLSSSTT